MVDHIDGDAVVVDIPVICQVCSASEVSDERESPFCGGRMKVLSNLIQNLNNQALTYPSRTWIGHRLPSHGRRFDKEDEDVLRTSAPGP